MKFFDLQLRYGHKGLAMGNVVNLRNTRMSTSLEFTANFSAGYFWDHQYEALSLE
jgi:hypothetical protein